MKIRSCLPFIFLCVSPLLAEEQSQDISKISESFGHIIYKNLECLDVKFDMEQLIKGIRDASSGKESPMAKKECIQALDAIQEENLIARGEENLKQAETFLANHAKEDGVFVLEEGKVQYRVMEQGNGAEIKPHFSPLVRYTVKPLSGFAFGPPEEDFISLDETIPGLKIGLLGMKEGEKRILYIHPDLAYGTKGCLVLPPNLLLTFEIEILKANTK